MRRQERLRHSAEIIQYAELAERCPMTTRALGHTSEAAAGARLLRIADVRSETAEQEDGAIHKSTSSAREKPTKVNVDDEGRSGFRSANGHTHQVWKRKAAQKRSACATRLV